MLGDGGEGGVLLPFNSETPRDSGPGKGSRRRVIGSLLVDFVEGGGVVGSRGHLEEVAGAAGVGDRGGQWELGVDPTHTHTHTPSASQRSQSHSGMAGRVGAVLSSRKRAELKHRASLPLPG